MTSLEDQLLDAIEQNDIPEVSSLIEKGVNVNNSISPLCVAAFRDRVEIVTMLLDAGADIDAGDHVFDTACYSAIQGDGFDTLKLLVERGAKVDLAALLKAAAELAQDDRIALWLLDAGAPLDALTSVDLINLVAGPFSVNIFRRLSAQKVDVCALRGRSGTTLCHSVTFHATRNHDDELIRAMIDAGINVDAVDDDNSTPLHFAGNSNSARVLVELGANIDHQQADGETALHLACASSWKARGSCAELMLALGANVHLVNERGQTASHLAASEQHRSNLSACLAAGGDLDHPDSNGDTARTIASRDGFQLPTADEIDVARRCTAKIRLDLVRQRAFQICIGLQPLNLNALELCEIMRHSFGALGSLIAFHQWWAIATTVKHFHLHNRKPE